MVFVKGVLDIPLRKFCILSNELAVSLTSFCPSARQKQNPTLVAGLLQHDRFLVSFCLPFASPVKMTGTEKLIMSVVFA